MPPRPASHPRRSNALRLFVALVAVTALTAADGTTSFEGAYEWNQGDRGHLFVEITPQGEGFWDVAFRVRQGRRFLDYEGEATGELSGGPFEGTVEGSRGARYGFRGAFEGGVFRGDHFELSRSGREHLSGTLSFE